LEGEEVKKFKFQAIVFASICALIFAFYGNSSAADVQELRFSTHIPTFAPIVKLYQQWGDEVGKATNGKIKVTMYAGGTLLKPADTISGIKSGIADIGLITAENNANERPLLPILGLAFLGMGDWREGVKILATLKKKYPAVDKEWSDFKVLFLELKGGVSIHTKTPVKIPADIKGMRLIGAGMLSEIINSMGGSSVNLDAQDWYTSIDRGLVKGMIMDWSAVYEMKIHSLAKCHTEFPKGVSLQIGVIAMNLKKWNNLSPDIQKAIDKVSSGMTERIGKITIESNNDYIAKMKKEKGHTFINLTEQEAQMWLDAASKVHQQYIAKAEARGLPAKAIYEDALKMAKSIKVK